VAAALAAAALAAAPAGAATWSPVRDATRAGEALSPAAAADAEGRFTIGFSRQIRDVHRAELRRGRLADGLRGASIVLDRSPSDVSSIALTQSPTGLVGAAWLRNADRAQGPRAATVTADGDVGGPVNLVPEGVESAFDPRWSTAGAPDPLLVWDRRTSSAATFLDGTSFGTPFPVPGAGLTTQLSVVAERGGGLVAIWSDGTRVLAATAAPGAGFAAPAALSGPGIARDPQLALAEDGTAVAAWVRNVGAGNVLEVATRPPGGTFGPPVAVSAAGEGAFSPRVVASSAGELVATWVAGPVDRGWGSVRGPLRMRRLTGGGEVIGGPVTLTPDGVRTGEAALADDGRGAVFIGWSSGLLAHREIGVRRLGRNGRLGGARELAAGRWELTGAPVLAAAEGRAVMVWAADGIVRYRLYG
jgi:hypothetical protein